MAGAEKETTARPRRLLFLRTPLRLTTQARDESALLLLLLLLLLATEKTEHDEEPEEEEVEVAG